LAPSASALQSRVRKGGAKCLLPAFCAVYCVIIKSAAPALCRVVRKFMLVAPFQGQGTSSRSVDGIRTCRWCSGRFQMGRLKTRNHAAFALFWCWRSPICTSAMCRLLANRLRYVMDHVMPPSVLVADSSPRCSILDICNLILRIYHILWPKPRSPTSLMNAIAARASITLSVTLRSGMREQAALT
jgi:hypothetical protein